MNTRSPIVLKKGTLAYYDAFALGCIAVKVTKITPKDSSKPFNPSAIKQFDVEAVVTEQKSGFTKGERLNGDAAKIFPRKAWQLASGSSYQMVIKPYIVQL